MAEKCDPKFNFSQAPITGKNIKLHLRSTLPNILNTTHLLTKTLTKLNLTSMKHQQLFKEKARRDLIGPHQGPNLTERR